MHEVICVKCPPVQKVQKVFESIVRANDLSISNSGVYENANVQQAFVDFCAVYDDGHSTRQSEGTVCSIVDKELQKEFEQIGPQLKEFALRMHEFMKQYEEQSNDTDGKVPAWFDETVTVSEIINTLRSFYDDFENAYSECDNTRIVSVSVHIANILMMLRSKLLHNIAEQMKVYDKQTTAMHATPHGKRLLKKKITDKTRNIFLAPR